MHLSVRPEDLKSYAGDLLGPHADALANLAKAHAAGSVPPLPRLAADRGGHARLAEIHRELGEMLDGLTSHATRDRENVGAAGQAYDQAETATIAAVGGEGSLTSTPRSIPVGLPSLGPEEPGENYDGLLQSLGERANTAVSLARLLGVGEPMQSIVNTILENTVDPKHYDQAAAQRRSHAQHLDALAGRLTAADARLASWSSPARDAYTISQRHHLADIDATKQRAAGVAAAYEQASSGMTSFIVGAMAVLGTAIGLFGLAYLAWTSLGPAGRFWAIAAITFVALLLLMLLTPLGREFDAICQPIGRGWICHSTR